MTSIRHLNVFMRKAHVALRLVKEAVSVCRRRGFLAATRFGVGVARGILAERSAGPRPVKSNIVDEKYGTDTAGTVKLHNLDIRSPNYRYAIYYQPTHIPTLTTVLERLSVRYEDYTFIDYGSGKGLVLLQAAGYPFKKVIGVEFARELHEIACRNVERYPAHLRQSEVELVHDDAVKFVPPSGNLVLYLNEPFEAPVTERLIARIREFWHGREVIVAYVWSKNSRVSCKPLWDAEASLRKLDEGDGWTIYRATD